VRGSDAYREITEKSASAFVGADHAEGSTTATKSTRKGTRTLVDCTAIIDHSV
jgi:hypothetical protein